MTMKKNYFFILLTLVVSSLFVRAQFINIPNGTFENWDSISAGQNPDGYESSNTDEANTVTRITGAQNGSYAVKLKSYASTKDTQSAYILMGEFGDMGPESGVPYSQKPDSLTGYYQCNVPVGDTALGLLMFWHSDSLISQNIFQFFGTQSTYSRFSFPINYMIDSVPDEMLIAFASSNALNDGALVLPGSELIIDNLKLVSTGTDTITEPIPNNDFENWHDLIYSDPQNWESANLNLLGLDTFNVSQTNDAYEGSSALKIVAIEVDGGGGTDTVSGIACQQSYYIAFIDSGKRPSGFAYSLVPEKISGYYKYAPAGADTASIGLEFRIGDSTISYEWIPLTVDTNQYIKFEHNINTSFLGAHDTAWIEIRAGQNPGSTLFLDNLRFELPGCMVSNVFTYDDTSSCDQYTINASGNGFDSWIWNDLSTNSTLTVDTSGIYAVEAIDADSSCNVFDTVNVTINVATKPIITKTGDTLTSGSASSYQWNKDGTDISGATAQSYIATASGTYKVIITDANGCTAESDTINVSITPPGNGLASIDNIDLLIYPNPSTGLIYINSKQLMSSIKVQDILGKEAIFIKEPIQGTYTLDLRNLEKGIYFVTIQSGTYTSTSKLILVK